MTKNPAPGDPIDWFPGVQTGPRVAIWVDDHETDLLRRMIDNHSFPAETYEATLVLDDLDVRLGAAREAGAAPLRAPLQFTEFDALRRLLHDYTRYQNSRLTADIQALFRTLLQRLGAEQLRRAGSGEMVAGEIGPDELEDMSFVEVAFDDGPAAPDRPQQNLRRRAGYFGTRWGRRNAS